jgi:RimJ/RimL family protein N-acetyltransferase
MADYLFESKILVRIVLRVYEANQRLNKVHKRLMPLNVSF